MGEATHPEILPSQMPLFQHLRLTYDTKMDNSGRTSIDGSQFAAVVAGILWTHHRLGHVGFSPLGHQGLRTVPPNLDPSSRGHRGLGNLRTGGVEG